MTTYLPHSRVSVVSNLYIALLHYPVYDKHRHIVATSVTNMDVHDISRAAKTYGVERFFIVTPLDSQRAFVHRILYHWQKGYGAVFNPSRKEALDILEIRESLDEVITDIKAQTNRGVRVVTTTASRRLQSTSYPEFSNMLFNDETNHLLLFGTGWGIAEEVLARADIILEPLTGPTAYNHLSVRSAVAIVLDRLSGQKR